MQQEDSSLFRLHVDNGHKGTVFQYHLRSTEHAAGRDTRSMLYGAKYLVGNLLFNRSRTANGDVRGKFAEIWGAKEGAPATCRANCRRYLAGTPPAGRCNALGYTGWRYIVYVVLCQRAP